MQPDHETIKLWRLQQRKHRKSVLFHMIFFHLFIAIAHVFSVDPALSLLLLFFHYLCTTKIIYVASSETLFFSLRLHNRIAWHNWWLLHYNGNEKSKKRKKVMKIAEKLSMHRKPVEMSLFCNNNIRWYVWCVCVCVCVLSCWVAISIKCTIPTTYTCAHSFT